MKVELVVTGRSYHEAEGLPHQWELEDGATVDDLLQQVNARLSEPLPQSCLVVLGKRHLGNVQQHENASLADGQEVLLVAPVAGG